MKIVGKVLKYLGFSILAVIVTLCIYILVVTGLLKKDYANVFGYTYFQVQTGSMVPLIEVNDLVIVKINSNYKKNDIITYKEGKSSFITHRVEEKNKNTLVTKGDANNVEDEAINTNQVVGKVVYIISTSFMLKLIAILIIIFILITLINFDSVFEHFVVGKKKKKKGSTIDISTKDILKFQEVEVKKKKEEFIKLNSEAIELLEEFTQEFEPNQVDSIKEQAFLNQVLKLLQLKNKDISKTKIDIEWKNKFEYLYQLALILNINDKEQLKALISSVNFEELYDYDFEKIGLSKSLENRLYDLPNYIFVRIMLYALIFDDEFFFDAVFKIFKYRVKVDHGAKFITYSKKSKKIRDRYKENFYELIGFIEEFAKEYDSKKVFNLKDIRDLVTVNNRLNSK